MRARVRTRTRGLFPAGLVAAAPCASCGAVIAAGERSCQDCGVSRGPAMVPHFPDRPQGWTRIGHMTDLHHDLSGRHRTYTMAWLDEFRAFGVDVVVISGDVMDNPTDSETVGLPTRELLERGGIPYLVVPGNHDCQEPGRPFGHSRVFGVWPAVVRTAGVEFILLNSMAGLPAWDRGRAERIFAGLAVYTEGRVGERQLEEVTPQLDGQASLPRVIVVHHHLTRHAASQVAPGVDDTIVGLMKPLEDAGRVKAWAARYNVCLVLRGHKHESSFSIEQGGVLMVGGESSTLGNALGAVQRKAWVVDVSPVGDRRLTQLVM